ncbi:carbamoyl-phosphate synthase small chain, chloroplastic-like isoform X2 [Impatiens glandulifera]|uniref:carbamoyl-phosphate synthase small chain, chloroplastic-like isoform X2 n=1 Tax=Impatiens glandulifera TaxID=253017 RepID=UPI001FB12D7D|nr:carbamoyl-phosphate synthase small chain, chloroplastic-like isoform X2 [Impatiens glandulifera]
MAAASMDISLTSFVLPKRACFHFTSRNGWIFTIRCSSSPSLPMDGLSVGLTEKPWKTADARLVLEDGKGIQVGEVVFNTRAITHRLRQDGSLIGVLSTENDKSDEQLLEMSQHWNIVAASCFCKKLYG